jgi:hypothetical protein
MLAAPVRSPQMLTLVAISQSLIAFSSSTRVLIPNPTSTCELRARLGINSPMHRGCSNLSAAVGVFHRPGSTGCNKDGRAPRCCLFRNVTAPLSWHIRGTICVLLSISLQEKGLTFYLPTIQYSAKAHPGMKMAESALKKMVVCFANVQEGRDVGTLREMARAASSWPGGGTYKDTRGKKEKATRLSNSMKSSYVMPNRRHADVLSDCCSCS